MLGKQGIIEEHEAEKIVEGLKGILKDIEEGNVEFSLDYEDIHMNVEQLLTERIGDTGKRLHTGRSRNDQVALDMRLYVKKEIKEIIKEAILEGEIPNDYEAAYALMERLAEERGLWKKQ